MAKPAITSQIMAEGRDCFVVATGPSMKNVPVDLLNSLPAIGVNGCVLREGLELDHLVAVDRLVLREAYWPTFCTFDARRWLYKPYFQWARADLTTSDMLFNRSPQGFYLDPNRWDGLYTCITVLGPAIHLAFLLGYKRVILVGVDCGLVDGQKHFYPQTVNDTPGNLENVASRLLIIQSWLSGDRELVMLKDSGADIGLPFIEL